LSSLNKGFVLFVLVIQALVSLLVFLLNFVTIYFAWKIYSMLNTVLQFIFPNDMLNFLFTTSKLVFYYIIYMYIDNIGIFSANVKFICMSRRNR